MPQFGIRGEVGQDFRGKHRVGPDLPVEADPGLFFFALDGRAFGAGNDCDGLLSCYRDSDGDGFGAAYAEAVDCASPGFSLVSGDCGDGDAATRCAVWC